MPGELHELRRISVKEIRKCEDDTRLGSGCVFILSLKHLGRFYPRLVCRVFHAELSLSTRKLDELAQRNSTGAEFVWPADSLRRDRSTLLLRSLNKPYCGVEQSGSSSDS